MSLRHTTTTTRTKNGLDLETGGKLKVLWEDEESVALVIKNVEERDAGLYCVVATNDLGQVESTAKLAIRGPSLTTLPLPHHTHRAITPITPATPLNTPTPLLTP
ncbi:hypothetical protein E2C01_045913 [Portunus trituberculatus]|uniref:Immunoglobulin I-set domain-containing protein n=1 Tax=Portunus trituberculatus TaxID=210409 RepID=A0A5B7G481_PORTR|nr:hypothetical protein [Portunus trituberculatus]